tara:strand:- start:595 stop:1317 length:723 start_codon:yes stop_codon:yes gene_type:complete
MKRNRTNWFGFNTIKSLYKHRQQLKVLDLFSGLEGWSEAFRDRGHKVLTLDNDSRFDSDFCVDIRRFQLKDLPWKPDVILASPPCNAFSVASIGKHWGGGKRAYEPNSDMARLSMNLIRHTKKLFETIDPDFFLLENPRGVLRKLHLLDELERRTVTYCQYGETRMKPTDLWGAFPPSLRLEPPCKNGDPCHEPAPRGARTGTQGLNRFESAKIPYELSLAVCVAAEMDNEAGVRGSRPW